MTKINENLEGLSKLQGIDITNNPISLFEQTVLSLSTIPNLIDLRISLSKHEEALLILKSIPNLHYLNGKSTKEEHVTIDIDEQEIDAISLNNEIENFNIIFNKISEKLKQYGIEEINSFTSDFQGLLNNEIEKINNCIDSSVPNYIYAANILLSKYLIYNFFNQKIISTINDKTSVNLLEDTNMLMLDVNKNLIGNFFKLL